MTDKLGSLLCLICYLGVVRWVARDALPFIIAAFWLALVGYVLLPFFWDDDGASK